MTAGSDRPALLRFIHDPYSHRGVASFLSFVVIIGLASILPLINSCDDNGSIQRPKLGVSGYVRLENQSDHSGVLLRIGELDSTAVTDSTGFFSFSGIPDGHWEMTAIYPFFERDTTEVEVVDGVMQGQIDITLEQLLQFWVEPTDTSLTMIPEEQDEAYFRLDLRGYLTNISDHAVRVMASSSPLNLLAFKPMEATPLESCYMAHGCLCFSAAIDWFDITFEPGYMGSVSLGRGLMRECFEPGPYEVFWCVSDQFNYQDHFNPRSDLNPTLLAKRELFRPASVTLVE